MAGASNITLERTAGSRCSPAAASGEPADHTPRIAFLSATAFTPASVKEFEEALQEAGWVSGRNIVIEYRSAEGQYDRLPGLIEETPNAKGQSSPSDGRTTTRGSAAGSRTRR